MTLKKDASAFAALGLDERFTAVLAELGYEEPTPVQKSAIPVLLEGRDLVGQAATGTGKTAAFALPLVQRLFGQGGARTAVAVLVLVPTRELAMQVAEAMHRYGRPVQLRALPIYGGQPISLQLRALRRGVDVVVATPGRARDHLRRGTLVLAGIRALVLDEADEMLDMGFAEDLEAILETVPEERQTVLFSATIPSRIAAIAKRHMREAVRLTVPDEPTRAGALPRIRQLAYLVAHAHKVDGLSRVLDIENPTSALIFCRTRNEVDELAESLAGRGHRAEALHGGFTQAQRDRVMRRFREGTAELLLATDVAARGLDIRHITHVVNYDVPSAPGSYVHRIGRTGRAGREGVAITLVEPRERALLRNIERLTGRRIELHTLPTLADLRARRLELTRASVREALLRGGTDDARVVVEALAAEFDVFDIATAAIHLIQEASERETQETELPVAAETAIASADRTPGREKRKAAKAHAHRATHAAHAEKDEPAAGERRTPPREASTHDGDRGTASRSATEASPRFASTPRRPHELAPGKHARREPPRSDVEKPGPRGPGQGAVGFSSSRRGHEARGPDASHRNRTTEDFTRIYVSAGRAAGVRPADLVGAIRGEAALPRDAIGTIELDERFSLIEVRESQADAVVEALRRTAIRGRPVTASRYRAPRTR